MLLLRIICVIAFIISLPLGWWQNTWFGTNYWELLIFRSRLDQLVLRSGFNVFVVLAFIFLLTCGGIAGIWYFYGWPAGLFALSLRWWIGRTSWNRQVNFEVDRCADYYYREMLRSKHHQGDPRELNLSPRLPTDVATLDDETMRIQAYNMAKDHVRETRLQGW